MSSPRNRDKKYIARERVKTTEMVIKESGRREGTQFLEVFERWEGGGVGGGKEVT